jgi:hypothetical protein
MNRHLPLESIAEFSIERDFVRQKAARICPANALNRP